MRPLALLSDFGSDDHYAGVLHAVLVREAPAAARFDLTHQVPFGDVWAGSFLVRSAWPHLPERCVVLAVVDPGVGTRRRAVAARFGERFVVAPDNGLARAVGVPDEAVALDPARMGLPSPSPTFHGRDLFAPAAAALARGEPLDALGEPVAPEALEPCPLPEPVSTSVGWVTTVLWVDRFGNVVTNLPPSALGETPAVRLEAGRRLRRVETFGDAEEGEAVALVGSSDLLELAVNRGSAAQVLGLERGMRVHLTRSRGQGE